MSWQIARISLTPALSAGTRLSARMVDGGPVWSLVQSAVGIPIRLIDADGNYLTDEAGNILTI